MCDHLKAAYFSEQLIDGGLLKVNIKEILTAYAQLFGSTIQIKFESECEMFCKMSET